MVPPLGDSRPSRRRFLRASGAALATGLSTFSAGCSSLPPLGTQVRYGSVSVPDAGDPTYRDWMPVPSAFPGGTEEGDGYAVMVYAPPPADAPAWAKTNIARSLVAYEADYVGVHVDDVDVAFTTATPMAKEDTTVLVGDVDRASVRETVGNTSYEPDGSEGGYDVYTRTDDDRSVCVFGDGLVFTNGPSARASIRAVVDARRGEVPRYHERDENVEVLTSSAGMRRWAWVVPGGVSNTIPDSIVEDTVGWADTFDHDGDSAYYVQTWVFPPGYDLTKGKVKRSLKEGGPTASPDVFDVTAVDVRVEGRVATVAMYMGPGAVDETLADVDGRLPFVTWSVSYHRDVDRLTFRHEAGDPVQTDWLTVDLGDTDVAATDAGDVGDRVEPGDDLTVSTAGLDPETTVHLVYEAPDRSSSSSLFSYDLP